MKQLTDRQKAAIYDDAVRELNNRIEMADTSTQNPENSQWEKGYYAGLFNGYKVAQSILTENEWVEYISSPTWKDKAKDLGTSFLFGAAVGCGAYALFYLLKFTFETFGLI